MATSTPYGKNVIRRAAQAGSAARTVRGAAKYLVQMARLERRAIPGIARLTDCERAALAGEQLPAYRGCGPRRLRIWDRWVPRRSRWTADERYARRVQQDRRYRRREQERLRRQIRRIASEDILPQYVRALPDVERRAGLLGASLSRLDGLAARYEAWSEYARGVAEELGQEYSGETHYRGFCTAHPGEAGTESERGEQYSRSCTYRRTDAHHTVWVSARLDEAPTRVVEASRGDGLPLVDWRDPEPVEGGHVAWVRWAVRKAKRLADQDGWIAWSRLGREIVTYHSTSSQRGAVQGLRRKVAEVERIRMRELEQRRQDREARAEHRRRDASLLRGGRHEVITVEAAAAASAYCRPGIEAWAAAHGLGGGRATALQLWLTGDSQARHVVRQVLAIRLAAT